MLIRVRRHNGTLVKGLFTLANGMYLIQSQESIQVHYRFNTKTNV